MSVKTRLDKLEAALDREEEHYSPYRYSGHSGFIDLARDCCWHLSLHLYVGGEPSDTAVAIADLLGVPVPTELPRIEYSPAVPEPAALQGGYRLPTPPVTPEAPTDALRAETEQYPGGSMAEQGLDAVGFRSMLQRWKAARQQGARA